MSDDQIRANEGVLHERLKRLADGSEQIKSMWIFNRNGRTLVNSLLYPSPPTDFSDRDYFKAHVGNDIGLFVGRTLKPRPPYGGAPFFSVSVRRTASDGSFAGAIQTSVLPDYFEGFYAKVGREAGSYAALVREDGAILARFPTIADGDLTVKTDGPIGRAMLNGSSEGTLTQVSALDGIERRVAYRKLPKLPVYVYAGLETQAIHKMWLAQLGAYLLVGLPATAALIAIVMLALARTRRLYEEARRREVAENALKQSQRLESLGRLTGGVAHDFNNLLMVVGGSVQKLRRRHTDLQDRRTFDMINSAVAKGRRPDAAIAVVLAPPQRRRQAGRPRRQRRQVRRRVAPIGPQRHRHRHRAAARADRRADRSERIRNRSAQSCAERARRDARGWPHHDIDPHRNAEEFRAAPVDRRLRHSRLRRHRHRHP